MWTGFQFGLQTTLNQKFATIHTFHLGKKPNVDPFTGKKDDERAQYLFGTHLGVNNWIFGCRWSPGVTQFNATYDKGRFHSRLQGQFAEQETKTGYEFELGLTQSDMCAQLKWQGPMVGVNYTQPVWPGYSVGLEYQYGIHNGMSRLKCIGKRESKKSDAATFASFTNISNGANQYSFSYVRPYSKNLDLITGLDLSSSEKKWSSLYKLGYNFKGEHGTVMGLWDSTLKVMCLVSEQLPDAPFSAQFCCKIDYASNAYEIGFSFMTMQ